MIYVFVYASICSVSYISFPLMHFSHLLYFIYGEIYVQSSCIISLLSFHFRFFFFHVCLFCIVNFTCVESSGPNLIVSLTTGEKMERYELFRHNAVVRRNDGHFAIWHFRIYLKFSILWASWIAIEFPLKWSGWKRETNSIFVVLFCSKKQLKIESNPILLVVFMFAKWKCQNNLMNNLVTFRIH